MVDLVRQRSYEDVRASVSSAAQRVFGNTLDTDNRRTPEGMLIDQLAASVHAHDRIVNAAAQ